MQGAPGVARPKMQKYFAAVGQKFGHLTVKEILPTGGIRRAHTKCDCGNESTPTIQNLNIGTSTTCGKNCPFHGGRRADAALTKMFGCYKRNAHTRDLEFNLTFEVFCSLVKSICYYCSSEPVINSWSIQAKNQIPMNGIDRINSDLGYTNDNTVPCCKFCNNAKWTMSREEYIALCRRVTCVADMHRIVGD